METKDQPWNPSRRFLNPSQTPSSLHKNSEKPSSSLITQKPFTIFLSKHRATACVVLNPSLSRRHLEPQQRHRARMWKFLNM
ncbi:hypothetical protein P8452_76630 [Trifolium repens]|nr:hypothetical protein P8452_76630 [Trifolium repens]